MLDRKRQVVLNRVLSISSMLKQCGLGVVLFEYRVPKYIARYIAGTSVCLEPGFRSRTDASVQHSKLVTLLVLRKIYAESTVCEVVSEKSKYSVL
jgi:hypothetical protein